jgi:histidinol-phosphate aminotransferase
LRVGYGIASPQIIDILNRLREPFNINSMAQVAATAALADKAYYRRIAVDVEKQRQFLYRGLTAMGIRYEQSFTNFILIQVPHAGQVALALLKKGIIFECP